MRPFFKVFGTQPWAGRSNLCSELNTRILSFVIVNHGYLCALPLGDLTLKGKYILHVVVIHIVTNNIYFICNCNKRKAPWGKGIKRCPISKVDILVVSSLRSTSTGLCLKNFEKRAHPNWTGQWCAGVAVALQWHCHGAILTLFDVVAQDAFDGFRGVQWSYRGTGCHDSFTGTQVALSRWRGVALVAVALSRSLRDIGTTLASEFWSMPHIVIILFYPSQTILIHFILDVDINLTLPN